MIAEQLAFDDPRRMTADGSGDLMADALAWIEDNPGAWKLMVEWAYRDASRYGTVRIKAYVEELRLSPLVRRPTGQPVKLKNALSAPFGRIMRDRYPELAPYIPIRASKCDGTVIPPGA